ncbi:NF038104 family lipoprotein [Acinetobacter sp. B51(2017)]|uniref:NF038104 family lipoprotein n=1 Tax=Acinetobacter sp. B51(2017) TaxID=2060938 RepID=UPI000F085874|nr:NF038104 family lipoprotein [Acinetobacter sp. B51(2017)]
MLRIIAIVLSVGLLQGCIHKVVTVPVKVAYKTTKGVVKGTAAVVGAVIPDGDDDDEDNKKNKQRD